MWQSTSMRAKRSCVKLLSTVYAEKRISFCIVIEPRAQRLPNGHTTCSVFTCNDRRAATLAGTEAFLLRVMGWSKVVEGALSSAAAAGRVIEVKTKGKRCHLPRGVSPVGRLCPKPRPGSSSGATGVALTRASHRSLSWGSSFLTSTGNISLNLFATNTGCFRDAGCTRWGTVRAALLDSKFAAVHACKD